MSLSLSISLGGDDYNNASMTYQWLPSQRERCFPLDIVDDNIVEGDEQFSVLLETSAERVTVMPDTSVITIVDNDSTTICSLC